MATIEDYRNAVAASATQDKVREALPHRADIPIAQRFVNRDARNLVTAYNDYLNPSSGAPPARPMTIEQWTAVEANIRNVSPRIQDVDGRQQKAITAARGYINKNTTEEQRAAVSLSSAYNKAISQGGPLIQTAMADPNPNLNTNDIRLQAGGSNPIVVKTPSL